MQSTATGGGCEFVSERADRWHCVVNPRHSFRRDPAAQLQGLVAVTLRPRNARTRTVLMCPTCARRLEDARADPARLIGLAGEILELAGWLAEQDGARWATDKALVRTQ